MPEGNFILTAFAASNQSVTEWFLFEQEPMQYVYIVAIEQFESTSIANQELRVGIEWTGPDGADREEVIFYSDKNG